MIATPSIVEFTVQSAVRSWVRSIVGTGVEVVQGLDNRVPTPKDDFISLIALARKPLSSVVQTYEDTPSSSVVEASQPYDCTVQVDAYGSSSTDWITALVAEWTTFKTCDLLDAAGVHPLYAEEARQLSNFIDGAKQYQHRWVSTLHLQYTPTMALIQDFATTASVSLINVEERYPIVTARFSYLPWLASDTTSVQFTDTSAGVPISWAWDFGDGTVSALQNPTHVFNSPGVYPVSMTITDADGFTSTYTSPVVVIPTTTVIITSPA